MFVFNLFNGLLLSRAYDYLKPTFCHSGPGNRDTLKYLKKKGFSCQSCWPGIESDQEGGSTRDLLLSRPHGLLCVSLLGPCACFSFLLLWMNSSVNSQNNLFRASSFIGPSWLFCCLLFCVFQLPLSTISVSLQFVP